MNYIVSLLRIVVNKILISTSLSLLSLVQKSGAPDSGKLKKLGISRILMYVNTESDEAEVSCPDLPCDFFQAGLSQGELRERAMYVTRSSLLKLLSTYNALNRGTLKLNFT